MWLAAAVSESTPLVKESWFKELMFTINAFNDQEGERF